MKQKTKKSPPRARLALRIGVSGHRPNRLKSADSGTLRTKIRNALEFLRDSVSTVHRERGSLYNPKPPVLRVISPLAEGSDRSVAEEAMALGFEIQCPLPFHIEEYEKDFETTESRAGFRSLLEKATAVLELDGSRETAELTNKSYEAVGRRVLSQSDVLIAIWDGKEASGQGGTGQIVGEAAQLDIPIVWIESQQPHPIHVQVRRGQWLPWESGAPLFSKRIEDLLLLPSPLPEKEDRNKKKKPRPSLSKAYFSESQREKTWGFLWRIFRDILADGKIRRPERKLPDFEQSTREEWDKLSQASPSFSQHVIDQINRALLTHYAWADKLADYYANVYRSAFIFNYLMAGVAVLFAYLGFAGKDDEIVLKACALVELVIIIAIIIITWLGTRRRWHERWIEYRLLAELLRQMRLLTALGHVPSFAIRLPADAAYGDPRISWMYWHFRAIAREAGMVSARFDSDYLKANRAFLAEEINGQVDYHKTNAERHENMNRRLHSVDSRLFELTAVAVFSHLFVHDELATFWLTFIAIVGPAFGAALAAIRSQGEFERVAKRSQAMAAHLEQAAAKLNQLSIQENSLSSVPLGGIASDAAQLMINELLDWHIIFQARPLTLPA